MSKKIVIIDYDMGNTLSISNALEKLGYDCVISSNKDIINKADALILPGVGAFHEAMKNINSKKILETLTENVIVHKKPILGICLGMHIMALSGEENEFTKGLGWIDANVKKINNPKIRVPHVGWNSIEIVKDTPLFKNITSDSHFYFDHSFHFICKSKLISSYTLYGEKIISSIQKGNIFATQFHPEKSQILGLQLLKNFLNFVEEI